MPHAPCLPDAAPMRCVYQPIVDLVSGEVLGHELLARTGDGQSPFAGPLTAEGRRRLERECLEGELVALGALEGAPVGEGLPPEGRFFLNVSPDTVCAADFPALLEGAGLEAGLLDAGPGGSGPLQGRLVLELTEHDGVEDLALLRARLEQLQGLGVRVALDDFGAGHSGLLTLVQVMPGYLKLDMGLIRDLHLHAYRQHLVRSLVAFATGVGSVLIAEGVEQWEELEALLALGVRHAQGYLVGMPTPSPCAPPPAFDEGRRRLLSRLPPARWMRTASSRVTFPPCPPRQRRPR